MHNKYFYSGGIGHYLNMTDPMLKVTGFGVTQNNPYYGPRTRRTSTSTT